jgi:hypothetical protein
MLVDADLAARHAPILCFDRQEPFLPSRVGFTILREPAGSPVDLRRTLDGPQPLRFDLPSLEAVVEYGVWSEVLVTALFEDRLTKTPADDERAAAYLRSRAFTPSFLFDQEFPIEPEHLCPWTDLHLWIPGRVQSIMEGLRDGRALD